VPDLYKTLNSLGDKQPPQYFQTAQKVGDCSIECFLSEMHDSFENYSTYLKVKINLLERSFAAVEALSESDLEDMVRKYSKNDGFKNMTPMGFDGHVESTQLAKIKEKMLVDIYKRLQSSMYSLFSEKERAGSVPKVMS